MRHVCLHSIHVFLCASFMTLPQAGVNAAPEAIVTSLIRADTAQQFNISLGAWSCRFASGVFASEGAVALWRHLECCQCFSTPSFMERLSSDPQPSLCPHACPCCLQMMCRWCPCARWHAAPSLPMSRPRSEWTFQQGQPVSVPPCLCGVACSAATPLAFTAVVIACLILIAMLDYLPPFALDPRRRYQRRVGGGALVGR